MFTSPVCQHFFTRDLCFSFFMFVSRVRSSPPPLTQWLSGGSSAVFTLLLDLDFIQELRRRKRNWVWSSREDPETWGAQEEEEELSVILQRRSRDLRSSGGGRQTGAYNSNGVKSTTLPLWCGGEIWSNRNWKYLSTSNSNGSWVNVLSYISPVNNYKTNKVINEAPGILMIIKSLNLCRLGSFTPPPPSLPILTPVVTMATETDFIQFTSRCLVAMTMAGCLAAAESLCLPAVVSSAVQSPCVLQQRSSKRPSVPLSVLIPPSWMEQDSVGGARWAQHGVSGVLDPASRPLCICQLS